ncbi:MFS transporter [Acetobacter sp. DmW_125133]|uniref:MFS transporter n=7 Tax=Acetobacter TaxID=434 RepID=A0AAN1U7Y7_9PROT|nr:MULTISPECIES: MFS transporter [Acetobacter]KAA8393655.1 MFS transporter [Acetobacter sp. DmW_125128]KAA8403773.1 MFS transporter [Acetobacter sp. DmW_125133]KAA8406740.1 MFS transporter [Acetobacter sp. DmW_125132]KAA8411508.1 MFS transporter [Acetobacter sp. DmW_125135]KAA8412719.1 MFS transporter [Acetobacter sp. DmW_125131]KAA8414815.1 MFS transporter [Acetobacter sp. DmW_125129]KAA8419234.1 MFS transporter [Acetobacter sp. DmW_125130]
MNRQTSTTMAPVSGGEATRRLLPFAMMVFLGYLTVGLPLAVLPVHVHDRLGFGPVMVGWVMASQSIATLLTRQFGGVVTDTRGPRPAVLIGMLLCSLAALVYGASVWGDCSPEIALGLLFVGRAVLGLGESLLITGALTWCIGMVGPRYAGRAMVWVGIAMFGAIGGGAPLGSVLLKQGGFGAMALAAAILPLLACLLMKGIEPLPLHCGRRLGFFKVVGLIWPYGTGLALSTIGFGTMFAFLGLDYAGHHWTGASLGLTSFGASYVAARLIFGGLPDQLGGLRVAQVTIPLQIVGLVILWLAPHPWIALAGCAILGAGYSLTFPALGVEAVRHLPPQNRGAAMGAYVAFVDIGLGLAGPLAGTVADRVGYPPVFLLGACASAVALTFVLRLPATQENI